MPPRFNIRRATSKDLDTLVRQRHMMFEEIRHRTPKEHLVGDARYRKWAYTNIKNGSLHCFLAVSRDGRVAGGGCVWLRPIQPSPGRTLGEEPYLLSMYTAPEFRRYGLATRIVREATKWSKGRGYQRMRLHASPMGAKVYSKLGWQRTNEMEIDLRKARGL